MMPMTRREHLAWLSRTAAAVVLTSSRGLLAATPAQRTAAEQRVLELVTEQRVLELVTEQRVLELVTEFMRTYEVPGLSLAIAQGGRLVLQSAHGFAQLETRAALNPAHRFRIASVSKCLTSVAIFRLIEEGRLGLNDKVFGVEGALGLQVSKPELAAITVRHLLTHTAGGWTNDGDDPMFREPALSQAELIAWTLEHQPLKHTPGEVYAYSNFGYCLLGRIIERLGKASYEELVRRSVLRPCGIEAMQIGGNSAAERLEREVTYYTAGKPESFRMNVRRMDSHGGWVATPTELVQFALRVDGCAAPADILERESLVTMSTGSAANAGYACGWSVNSAGNCWHGGSLPGSTSLLVRSASGACWAACANTRRRGIDLALDRLMWRVFESL